MSRRRLASLGCLAALVAAGCPSLGEIQLGVCGNGVVEEDLGEECDTPENDDAQSKVDDTRTIRCAGPGEANACHYVWSGTICCPIGQQPGADGRCRAPSQQLADTVTTLSRSATRADVGDIDGDEWPDLLLSYENNDLDLLFFEGGGDVREELRLQRATESRPVLGTLGAARSESVNHCGERPPRTGALLLPSSAGVRLFLGREGPDVVAKALTAFDVGLPSRVLGTPIHTCVPDVEEGRFVPLDLQCPSQLSELAGDLVLFSVSILGDLPFSGPHGLPPPLLERHSFDGRSLTELTEQPVHLDLPGWAGCDGLAAWFDGGEARRGGMIEVIGFCDPSTSFFQQFVAAPLQTIAVQDEQRPFFVDATGDGDVDLVLVSGGSMEVWAGDGAGRFDRDGLPTIRMPQFGAADGSDLPVALGHLDGDAVIDVVHAFAVWESGGRCAVEDGEVNCEWRFAAAQLPENNAVWDQARLGDINGDGRPDVVATRRSAAGEYHAVDFLLSNDSDILTQVPIPTARPVRELAVNDFDGDGVDDVVYVVPAAEAVQAAECARDDELSVVFGGDASLEAILTASLRGVRNMASGRLLFARDTFDGLADLGVATHCAAAGTHRAAVLLGTPQRRLDSPLPLDGAGDDARSLFATGNLDGDEAGIPDVIALSAAIPLDRDPAPGIHYRPLNMYVLRGDDDGDLTHVVPVPGTGEPPSIPGTLMPTLPVLQGDQLLRSLLPRRAALHVGELDCHAGGSCAAAEAALFLSSEAPAEGEERNAPRLLVLRYAEGAMQVEAHPTSPEGCGIEGGSLLQDSIATDGIATTAYTSKRTDAVLVDADGDGALDAIGWWTGKVDEKDPASPLAGGAVIFWNGDDGFGGRCPERVLAPPGETIVRIAPFAAGGDEPALLVATTTSIHVLRPGKQHRVDACSTGDTDVCAPLFASGELPPTLRDVAVMDFDQDGLDDVVILTGDEVRMVGQVPSDQSAAEEGRGAQ